MVIFSSSNNTEVSNTTEGTKPEIEAAASDLESGTTSSNDQGGNSSEPKAEDALDGVTTGKDYIDLTENENQIDLDQSNSTIIASTIDNSVMENHSGEEEILDDSKTGRFSEAASRDSYLSSKTKRGCDQLSPLSYNSKSLKVTETGESDLGQTKDNTFVASRTRSSQQLGSIVT